MPELKKEQKEAIFHDEGNILVSASAGSGKTFVMIERLIRLICEGKAKVKEILAATFTEAAASEMKERLKKALAEKIAQGEDRLAEELADVYAADICTLHAFCGRLIRSYFFAAGVAPDFKIADEDAASELKTRAIEQTFKEFYESKDPDFLKLADRYKKKRSDAAFKEIILFLHAYCESEKDPGSLMEKTLSGYSEKGFAEIKKEYNDCLLKALRPIKNSVAYALNGFREVGSDSGAAFAETLYNDIVSVEGKGLYAVKGLENYSPAYSFKRNLDAKTAELKETAVAARNEMKSVFKRFSANLKSEEEDLRETAELKSHTQTLFKIANRFGEIYAEKKRAENVLDFGDLESFALKVLDDENVLSAVKAKYKYIFVDEYQDVNGAQEEIISRISNGNAFAVGDVKQSIYGFRGCRPEIFAEKAENMRRRGEKTVLLNHNFRSSDKVIETVNDIFSYSMTKDYFGENYKDVSRLVAGGVYEGGGEGRAELHLLKTESATREKEIPRVYDVLEEIKKRKDDEEADIAALIANIIRGELEKTYYSPKEKRFKRVTFSDVVVLTRNRNGAYVSRLVAGLIKRGIPVASEVKQDICERPEIAVLINALKLADCFIDDIPLVSVLKSKIGGFTEEDLAAVALFYAERSADKKGGFYKAFDYYLKNADTELKDRLAAFKAYFDEIRFLSDYYGAGRTLEKLISDCYYEDYLLTEPNGEKKVKRVRRFVSLAEGGEKTYTVSEFLRKIENGGDAFCVSECGGEDNVRIMTIHASKGLEFPVVIVCGLERKTNKREEFGEVLSDRGLGFAVRFYDDEKRTYSETLLRGLVKEKMRENRMKEELRLFYVATTRAAYSLHLTFEGKEDKRKAVFTGAERFLDYVPADLPVTEWDKESFGAAELKREPRKILVGKTDEKLVSEMRKNFGYTYPYSSACSLPLKTAVTSLLKKEEYGAAEIEGDRADAERVYGLSRGTDVTDTERGTTAHAVMQYIDFTRTEEFDLQLKTMTETGLISAAALSEINTERIKRALSAKIFGELKNRKLYREKSFIVAADAASLYGDDGTRGEQVVMQGVIDLLATGEEDAFVVDYKYSRASAETLKHRYKKQLDLYAETVEKLLGKKVRSKTIVNLYSGETIEIT